MHSLRPLRPEIQKCMKERREEPGNFLPDPDYSRVMDGKCREDDRVISNIELMHHGYEVVQTKDVRVQFGRLEGERLFYCPYTRAHQILESKWTQHLPKCRRNYLKAVQGGKPIVKMDTCPYAPNTHHLSEFYMERHVFICPNREAYDEQMTAFESVSSKENLSKEGDTDSCQTQSGSGSHDSVDLNPDPNIKLDKDLKAVYLNPINCDAHSKDSKEFVEEGTNEVNGEGWKEDELAGGYSPQDKLSRGFYYQTPKCLTKSEREEFDQKNAEKVEALGGWKSVCAQKELEYKENEKRKNPVIFGAMTGRESDNPNAVSKKPNLYSWNYKPDPYEQYLKADSVCANSSVIGSNVAVMSAELNGDDDDESYWDYDSDSDSTLKAESDDDYDYETDSTVKACSSDDCSSSYSYEQKTNF